MTLLSCVYLIGCLGEDCSRGSHERCWGGPPIAYNPAAGGPRERPQKCEAAPAGRAQLVQRVLADEPTQAVVEATGVSAPTVYMWLRRWKAEAEAGLVDRSSQPNRMPRRRPRHRRRQIERFRRGRDAAGMTAPGRQALE